MSPGANLVNLLKSRNDPRLAEYFAPNSDGQYVGAAPGQQGSASISEFDADRTGPAFRQPIATAAENNLIVAESAFQLGQAGLALSALNAERGDAGLPPVAATTLADIMSSFAPNYARNLQTGASETQSARTRSARITIHHDTRHPSRIIFPVIPRFARDDQ